MFDFFSGWFKKIRESDNQEFFDRINALKLEVDGLKSSLRLVLAENEDLISSSVDLQLSLDYALDELNRFKKRFSRFDKHLSLETFKAYVDSISDKKVFYNFGSGKKRVHKAFSNSLKDEEEIKSFITNVLKFDGSKYSSADSLVYSFNRAISKMFPTKKYYASDQDLYGTREFWATAKQTITKLMTKSKAFDCDDSMILRYSCLYYLLKDYFPNDVWRLRGFIVDLWIGGGHALLGWVKEGVNDWIIIESTFRDENQNILWNDKYVIRNQLFYQIRYSFNNEFEFVKI